MRQRLVGLLDLGLLLNPAGGRAAPARERARCRRIDALDRVAGVLQLLQLLRVGLKVPLDLELRARLGHVLRIEHDVRVRPCHRAPENVIRHRHRALGALRAVRTHAPAQPSIAIVQGVLLVDQPAHVAKGHARAVLAEAPERHVGEMPVVVDRRAIEQAVRPQPVAAPHLGHRRAHVLHPTVGQRKDVRRVVGVVLHHAPIRAFQHHHVRPAPIPKLGHAHFLAHRVEPAVFHPRPLARDVPCPVQARAAAAVARLVILGPPVDPGPAVTANQLLLLREHPRQPRRMQPALPTQPARVAQIVARARPIPVNLVAMHRLALVGVVERVGVARHLHPTDAHGDLRVERIRAGIIGMALALGLIQPEVDRVRHVLAALLSVGRHPPVRARGHLIAANSLQRSADQVLHRRWDALGLHRPDQLGVQLISLRVVHLLVRVAAPGARLRLDFLDDLAVLGQRQRHVAIWRVHGVEFGVVVGHDRSRQTNVGSGASVYVLAAAVGAGMP